MNKKKTDRFRVDWVLKNELALGPAPQSQNNLITLEEERISCILNLCSDGEIICPTGIEDRFVYRRSVLPDHTSGRLPTLEELIKALSVLKEIKTVGPIFVHCFASVERSPLVCLAWLIREHSMSPTQALDYLMQVHRGTNPLPGQLALLRQL